MNSLRESRIECPKGIIFFDNLWFWVDSNKFQKLRTSEDVNNFCVDKCEWVCKTRVKILSILSAQENEQIKDEWASSIPQL